MRIKVKELLVVMMFIFSIVSALSYMRYAAAEVDLFMHIHLLAMLSIDFLCLIYIIFSFTDKVSLKIFLL